jgi:hypothetical protein
MVYLQASAGGKVRAVISKRERAVDTNLSSRDPRMPKGPPTIPILGNLLQLPLTGIHKK